MSLDKLNWNNYLIRETNYLIREYNLHFKQHYIFLATLILPTFRCNLLILLERTFTTLKNIKLTLINLNKTLSFTNESVFKCSTVPLNK